jgi:hypothetical protein
MSVRQLYLIGAAAILGCASNPSEMGIPKSSSSFVTANDISAAKADNGSLFDALSRLRPNWLVAHGTMSSNPDSNPYAAVFLDGQHYGNVDALRRIPAYHVQSARYYDITQAGARFGIRAGMGGVIEVVTR